MQLFILTQAVYDDEIVSVKLITSKSRVAPLKNLPIHRLELVAAVMLSKLVRRVVNDSSVSRVYCFTDNSAVLGWMCQPIENSKPYVGNCVKTILTNTLVADWHYV